MLFRPWKSSFVGGHVRDGRQIDYFVDAFAAGFDLYKGTCREPFFRLACRIRICATIRERKLPAEEVRHEPSPSRDAAKFPRK